MNKDKAIKPWDVHVRFKHPAWDMTDGIWYRGILASGKAGANKQARKLAQDDGHIEAIYLTAHQAASDAGNQLDDDD